MGFPENVVALKLETSWLMDLKGSYKICCHLAWRRTSKEHVPVQSWVTLLYAQKKKRTKQEGIATFLALYSTGWQQQTLMVMIHALMIFCLWQIICKKNETCPLTAAFLDSKKHKVGCHSKDCILYFAQHTFLYINWCTSRTVKLSEY